jgi:glycosyltransferase involved in cell wall biosynthesis
MIENPARILIVAPRVWDGGMELHLSNLALLYATCGHHVTLAVHPRFPAHAGRACELIAAGVEFVRVSEFAGAPLPVRLWRRRAALCAALRGRSFDVLSCEGFGCSLPWFRRFLAPGGRFFWHEHIDGARAQLVRPGFYPPRASRYPWLFRRMFRHLDAALVGCQHGADNLRRVQRFHGSIHVLPPLMAAGPIPDATDRETGARPLNIGVFGAVEPRKGADALLRLWPSLAIGPATLHFHGPLFMSPLDGLARELGVPAVFDGPYRSEDLATLMPSTDLALILSVAEGYPFSAWECMAWGVPFVITDVGAAPELTRDNPNARLAALEPAAVRCAIEEHVDALRRGRLSRVALQQHQRRLFRPEDVARAYLDLLA